MAQYLALRDRRLSGGVPQRPRLHIVNTDGSTPLRRAFRAINAAARSGGRLHSMFILCHGFAGQNARARVSGDFGGEGLQLGSECVLHENVSDWEAIRGAVSNIVIYACAAADTQPNNVGTNADGRYLIGALAIHTNAVVYAADRIQWYSTHNNLANGRYDFGGWEGRLLEFPPTGGSPVVVHNAPVEIADVFNGAAP
jgi:hypothetical protein